ncbi:LLM class F420-dependent oxidoreductase [Mycolicibacterium hippocampi]|uniref:LLM class F420-dependent oxidoreductase n=1 Tax=Mycolicibacterium hippocampi TaxID=659824 RepID=A0A7I9ZHU6_9MYCO|nr:LLM class F420-dependent oxidoreductase [Mycolicibacterium hippocampi]GFH00393.1 LLM class F420-dependent oxidoreductase [Mycolicibacterium hippocampi]
MKLGLFAVNVGAGARPAQARATAVLAEELGLESLWAIDHVVMPSGYETEYPYDESGKMMGGAEEVDIADPLTWLAFAAAVTRDIKLGTGVIVLPQRNPVVLAKQAATLDVLSEGRLLLGVGVGWLAEEFDAVGVPFADRGRRHDDYVAAMRALWRDTKASVHNTYTQFDNAISLPQPAARAVPVVIGGRSNRSARRAAGIGDGYFPSISAPEQLIPLLDIMNAEAERLQRDPAGIEVTVPYPGSTAELIAAAAGDTVALDRVVTQLRQFAGLGVARTLLAGLGEDTLRPLLKQLADHIDLG